MVTGKNRELFHHNHRGSQYLSMRYSVKLAEAGTDAFIGSIGGSYNNAFTGTINGIYETEIVRKGDLW